jgi:hypothetical protein
METSRMSLNPVLMRINSFESKSEDIKELGKYRISLLEDVQSDLLSLM